MTYTEYASIFGAAVKRFFFSLFAVFLSSLSAISPPLQDILDLFGIQAEQIQERWMQKGKERWEFDKRYEYMHDVAWPFFEKAGLISEAAPHADRYDYALIHGALLQTVEKRIAYLADQWKKGVRFDQLVFLTGERPLLDSETAICSVEMESEMVEWAYSQSELPKEIPVIFINTAGRKKDSVWIRPQTVNTIAAWLQTNPRPGSCLAVSNQPYVDYQHAVLQSLLPSGFAAETVGPAVQGEPSVALILDTISKQLLYDAKVSASGGPLR